MNKTHWKKLTNPDYLGAYALNPNQEIIVTISKVQIEKVKGSDGKEEECTVARFVEKDIKPMILNATNSKIITKLYNTPYIEDWQGRKIQIYATKVKAFGELVEALRIRNVIPKQAEISNEKEIVCADCNKNILPYGNMGAIQIAKYTYEKYGKSVCSECATILSEKTVTAKDALSDEDNTDHEEVEEINIDMEAEELVNENNEDKD